MKLSFPLTTVAALLLFKSCLGKVKEDSIDYDSVSDNIYVTPDDYEENYFDVAHGEETVYVTLEPTTVYITVTETITEQALVSSTKIPEIKTLTFITTKLTTNVKTETEVKGLPIFESSYSAPTSTSSIAINITTNITNSAALTTTKRNQSNTPGELNLVFGTNTSKDSLRDTTTGTGLLNKDLTTKVEYTAVPSNTTDIVGSKHVTSSMLEYSSKYFEQVPTNESSSKKQIEDTITSIPVTSSFSEEVFKISKNRTDVTMNSTLSNTHKNIDTKYDILEGFSPYSDLPTADIDLSNAGSSNFNLKMGTVILGAATIFFVVGTIVL